MQPEEFIQSIKKDLAHLTVGIRFDQDINRAVLDIKPEHIVETGKYLFEESHCRLITATAVDKRTHFEIYYHFSHDETGMVCHVRVSLDHDKPEIDSIAYVTTAANWIEREMHELYGIGFIDHPNLEPLISEGNWPKGIYPFRKNEN